MPCFALCLCGGGHLSRRQGFASSHGLQHREQLASPNLAPNLLRQDSHLRWMWFLAGVWCVPVHVGDESGMQCHRFHTENIKLWGYCAEVPRHPFIPGSTVPCFSWNFNQEIKKRKRYCLGTINTSRCFI